MPRALRPQRTARGSAGPRFEFAAVAAGKKADGAGTLDLDAKLGGAARLAAEAGAKALAARVTTWKVRRLDPVTTLALSIQVETSTDPGCRPGTVGTAVLVDDETKLANGRPADSVKIRLPGASCRALAATWTNALAGSEPGSGST